MSVILTVISVILVLCVRILWEILLVHVCLAMLEME